MGITLYCTLTQESKSSLMHTVAATSLKRISRLKKADNYRDRTKRQLTETNVGRGGAGGSDLAEERFLLPGTLLLYNTPWLAHFIFQTLGPMKFLQKSFF